MKIKSKVNWSDGDKSELLIEIESISFSDNELRIYLFGDYDYFFTVPMSSYQFAIVSDALLQKGFYVFHSEVLTETPFDDCDGD